MCLLLGFDTNEYDPARLQILGGCSSPYFQRSFMIIVPLEIGPDCLVLAESLAPPPPITCRTFPVRVYWWPAKLLQSIADVIPELAWVIRVEARGAMEQPSMSTGLWRWKIGRIGLHGILAHRTAAECNEDDKRQGSNFTPNAPS